MSVSHLAGKGSVVWVIRQTKEDLNLTKWRSQASAITHMEQFLCHGQTPAVANRNYLGLVDCKKDQCSSVECSSLHCSEVMFIAV